MTNIHSMSARMQPDTGSGSSSEVASDLAKSAGEALEKAQDKASELAGTVSTAVSQAADKAAGNTKDLWHDVETYVRANPIPVLIGTAAAGAIVALALSRNRGASGGWARDMARYSEDAQRAMRREMRAVASEARINKLIDALPTTDVAKTVGPLLSQLLETVTSAGAQARDAVSKTAQAVQQTVQSHTK